MILPEAEATDERLVCVGTLERLEAENVIVGYTAELRQNTLLARKAANPGLGTKIRFVAYRNKDWKSPIVSLISDKELDEVKHAENDFAEGVS